MGGAASRNKGAQYERDVAAWLCSQGRRVERRISGMANDSGDFVGIPGCVIDAKNRREMNLAAWVDQLGLEMLQADAETGVVIAKRRGVIDVGRHYAIQTVAGWHDLLVEAGR